MEIGVEVGNIIIILFEDLGVVCRILMFFNCYCCGLYFYVYIILCYIFDDFILMSCYD